MDKLKIAHELVRIAKGLMARGFVEGEDYDVKPHLAEDGWWGLDIRKPVTGELRKHGKRGYQLVKLPRDLDVCVFCCTRVKNITLDGHTWVVECFGFEYNVLESTLEKYLKKAGLVSKTQTSTGMVLKFKA